MKTVKRGLSKAEMFGYRYATAESVAAMPLVRTDAHRLCFDPSLVSTDSLDRAKVRKFSADIWGVIKRLTRHCGDDMYKLPATPTPADRRYQREAKARLRTLALADLRILLIADSEIGEPCLLTGGVLHFTLGRSNKVDEEGQLVSFVGATTRRPDRWHERKTKSGAAPFIDVTNLFWDQYLLYGMCAREGKFKEEYHRWDTVTSTSRRCACCGMWSYRRRQRTVTHVEHNESVLRRERVTVQTPVWEHQESQAHRNPYFRLVNRTED